MSKILIYTIFNNFDDNPYVGELLFTIDQSSIDDDGIYYFTTENSPKQYAHFSATHIQLIHVSGKEDIAFDFVGNVLNNKL